MFLIKKPKWLEFVREIYDPVVSKAARRQIRHTGDKTNAKIIKMKSGEMYIKVGKELYLLKPANLPLPYKIVEKNEDMYKHKYTVDTKYYINEIKK
ncbi:hypothetical protein BDAP_002126 [Binucleata daphniae]